MNIKSFIAATAIAFASVTSAHATLLTFDEIGIPGTTTPGGPITQGFQLSSNADVIDLYDSWWSGTGPAYSGNYSLLNDWGGNVTLTQVGGSTFSFQDLFIKSWFGSGNGSNGTLTGFLGGVQVGVTNFVVSSDWQNVQANFAGIDALTISTGSIFLVDDVTLNGATDVPEPTTLALLGLGLLGFGVSRRRKAA